METGSPKVSHTIGTSRTLTIKQALSLVPNIPFIVVAGTHVRTLLVLESRKGLLALQGLAVSTFKPSTLLTGSCLFKVFSMSLRMLPLWSTGRPSSVCFFWLWRLCRHEAVGHRIETRSEKERRRRQLYNGVKQKARLKLPMIQMNSVLQFEARPHSRRIACRDMSRIT